MTQNIHRIERPIRVVLGIGLIAGGGVLLLSSWIGVAVIALGFVPLLTGAAGSCPAYSLLGVSTASES
jgi:hypothetical protein